jgi:maleylacetate reductase
MGLHHKLGYVLGGKYQLPHAGVHSALLPQVVAFNAPAGAGAFGRAACALGVRGPEAVGPALFDLATQIKAPTPWPILAWRPAPSRRSARPSPPLQSPPRIFTQQDLDYLLRQAYVGNRPEERSSS